MTRVPNEPQTELNNAELTNNNENATPISPPPVPVSATDTPRTASDVINANIEPPPAKLEKDDKKLNNNQVSNSNPVKEKKPDVITTPPVVVEEKKSAPLLKRDEIKPIEIKDKATPAEPKADAPTTPTSQTSDREELKDYKRLYDDLMKEHEKMKRDASIKEQEWQRTRRQQLRKISEYEEEVKLLEQLEADNQRLKDENGALIRVISKLSK